MTIPSRSTARAATMAEFRSISDLVFQKDSYDNGKLFVPRSTDIIICPYFKCGTTWLQQITHGLRSRGDMNFEEISFVVPWIEVAQSMHLNLTAPQGFEPRLFKSHYTWDEIPKGCRYICAVRDPEDMIVSLFRFMENWFIEPGTVDLDTFAQAYCPDDGRLTGYWLHLTSWWEQQANPNILFLAYENMIEDSSETVKQIADFMQIQLDDALLERVLWQSSREFMLAHKDRFDERGIRRLAERLANLPFESDAFKVTENAPRAGRLQLSESMRQKFAAVWRDQIHPRLGYATYDALRRSISAHA